MNPIAKNMTSHLKIQSIKGMRVSSEANEIQLEHKQRLIADICDEIHELFVRRCVVLETLFGDEVTGIRNVLINFVAIFIDDSSLNERRDENLRQLFEHMKMVFIEIDKLRGID